MSNDYPVHKVTLNICEPCIDGVGEECHTSGCDLFLHGVDIPILAAREQVDGLRRLAAEARERADMTLPSELLQAAADRVRDLAAQATPGPWKVNDDTFPEAIYADDADARWIVSMSPALAPDLSALLVALDGRDFGAARVIAQRLSAAVLGVDAHLRKVSSSGSPPGAASTPDPCDGRQWCAGCQRWKHLMTHSCPGGIVIGPGTRRPDDA